MSTQTGQVQTLNGTPLVVVAHQPGERFLDGLREAPFPVIADDGEIWRACGVSATPLVIRVDEDGRTTTKEVTHRVDSFAEA